MTWQAWLSLFEKHGRMWSRPLLQRLRWRWAIAEIRSLSWRRWVPVYLLPNLLNQQLGMFYYEFTEHYSNQVGRVLCLQINLLEEASVNISVSWYMSEVQACKRAVCIVPDEIVVCSILPFSRFCHFLCLLSKRFILLSKWLQRITTTKSWHWRNYWFSYWVMILNIDVTHCLEAKNHEEGGRRRGVFTWRAARTKWSAG